MSARCRIAVVSPFVDRSHGTERRVAELVERLQKTGCYEIYLYSQRVADLAACAANIPPRGGRLGELLVWRRVPSLRAPNLVSFLWWFAANSILRWWDRRVRGIQFDLVYSAGVNALDAEVICVHELFTLLCQTVRASYGLGTNPARTWPRALHRRIYYALVALLERKLYRDARTTLVTISRTTASHLVRLFGRQDLVRVVHHEVDLQHFNPQVRAHRRAAARAELGLEAEDFALLLIGNDWRRKGLPCLLAAAARLGMTDLQVLVVGADDTAPFKDAIRASGLEGRVRFLPVRPDVEFYYAAADAYAGPSLQDAFGLPPAEAMACGLPTIVSSRAGVSELVEHAVHALVLRDPADVDELAGAIEQIRKDESLRKRLSENATQGAQRYRWDPDLEPMHEVFQEVLAAKTARAASVLRSHTQP